jgi:predicted nuclease of predicted toxin-antitoxin system
MNFLLDHDVPDDLSFLLIQLGHEVTFLRDALPVDSSDDAVLECSYGRGCILITCNRDDFLRLAQVKPHHGIIIVIRRRTRAAERAALLSLVERAGPSGISSNINFA